VSLRYFSLPDPDGQIADFRDYHERVGRALVQVFALSHRIAFGVRPDDRPLATVADLRAIRSDVLNAQDDAAPDLAQVGIEAAGMWAWFRYLIAPESDTIVKPNDLADDAPGRWVTQILPIGADCGTHRYIAHLDYLSAQVSNKTLVVRARNKTPAVFICFAGDLPSELGQTKAQHRIETRYTIKIISANFHGGVQAKFQSPLEIERASDPGAQRIAGDLRRVLTMGYQLQQSQQMPANLKPWQGCLGVETIKLGGLRQTGQWDAERMVLFEMDITVIGNVGTSNTPCEILDPWQMWVQLQDQQGNPAAAMGPFQVQE